MLNEYNVNDHLTERLELENLISNLIKLVGEDPNREGLKKTPLRVSKMYYELLSGYEQKLNEIVNGALFDVSYGDNEMIAVDSIPYNSMCEHHMLPFFGRAHIAYIPSEKIIGLSKIPRIVDMYSKRLQVQERMTNQIADALEFVLKPLGVMVFVEGEHTCASIRGVKKHGVSMKTTAIRGAFRDNKELRDDFFRILGK